MRPVTRTVAAVLLVLGGLGYADWVIQLFLPVQAGMMTSFISELCAGGQPHQAVFRVADVAGGALLVAGGAISLMGAGARVHRRREALIRLDAEVAGAR